MRTLLSRYSAADRRFHALVAQISENEALIEQVERLSMPIQMMRSIANRDPDVVERTAHERRKSVRRWKRAMSPPPAG